MRIAVVDVGVGNVRSVERALHGAGGVGQAGRIPVEVDVTHDPDRVRSADKVVMPGQGSFGACMGGLGPGGLAEAVREQIARGAPYFGICLGLQVLFATSDEAPGTQGLAVLAGRVRRVQAGIDPETGSPRKVPHVGWNMVEAARSGGAAGGTLMGKDDHFYFVHGFVVVPDDRGVVVGTTEYGERFVSAVERDNVFACQFHPEKSARAGRALLERFVRA